MSAESEKSGMFSNTLKDNAIAKANEKIENDANPSSEVVVGKGTSVTSLGANDLNDDSHLNTFVPVEEKPKPKKVVKKTGLELKDVQDKITYRFSKRPKCCITHGGVICIATITTPVKTKKKFGFEIRYGVAFCSPDDKFDKNFGKKEAVKKLLKDTTCGTAFLRKNKMNAQDILLVIYSNMMAQSTFPYWARHTITTTIRNIFENEDKQRALKEEHALDARMKGIAHDVRKGKNIVKNLTSMIKSLPIPENFLVPVAPEIAKIIIDRELSVSMVDDQMIGRPQMRVLKERKDPNFTSLEATEKTLMLDHNKKDDTEMASTGCIR